MQIGLKSQSSLEYLIVMGIAIFILGAAISYAIYYQVGYNSAGTSQDLQLAATSIANAVNSLSGGGIGSSQQFSFSSPGLNLVSSICNTSISLSYGGEEASQSLSLYTTGELPVGSGTYVGKVTLVKENGKPEAQISMDLPISYISTSYIYNPSSIFYNVSFLDTNGNLVGDVNFTIIVYNHNKIVAEQNESTLSGYYSGSITPNNGGQFSSSSTAEIYVSSLNIISPACFLPQQLLLVPKGILNFVPLTIKNNQSIATPSPFQQEVVVDSENYQQYEASNLQNVEFFYPNGTTIDSWLESGNSNTATNSVYWLKLSGVPASSSITIYMGFASKSANLLNNTNDGEAPQLSSTYAEYDDGANVFSLYFNGNTATSDFVTGGGDTVTQETGIDMPGGNTGNALRFTTGSSEAVTTVDMFTSTSLPNNPNYYIAEASFQSDGSGTDMDWGLAQDSGTATSDNAIFVGTQYGGAYFDEAYLSGGSRTSDINGQGTTTTAWRYSSLIYNSSSDYYGYIAPQLYSISGGYSGTVSTNPISSVTTLFWGFWGDVGASGHWTQFNWVRVRAYPPNGVMPSVTFGPVEPQITVFVNGVKDGNNGIAYGDITNITAFGIHASHIGLMINGSVVIPLGSASLSYQKPLSTGLYNITVFSNQSNLANETYWEAVANIPKNVKEFVPISITNLQSSATSSVFQDNVSINSFDYNSFENNTLSNVEFFSPSGSVIPAWLESGDLAYFNGVNSYANLPENYPFGTASTFTISVWFKTTSDGVVLWNGNSEQVSSSVSCYSPIIYVNTNGDLAGGDWTGSQPFNTNHFVANGKWNFVTIVQTPSQQILYLNGTEIATHSGTPQTCSPAYWTIGEGNTSGWANTNGGNFYFNGHISNVQFYNQVFSPSKVVLLYDEGVAGSPLNSSGLIAWYLLAGNGNQQNGHNTLSINNVEFNGVSSASTSTLYWLKLGSIQPRESYIAFMGFALPNISLFNNVNDGEAPQLSPTYAEYDDGANVFNFYDNFAGTTVNSEWSQVIPSGTTISQNNGITISTDSSSYYGGLILTNGYTGTQIFEGDITAISGVASGLALQTGNSATSGGIDFNYWSGSVAYGSMQNGMTGNNNPNLQVSTGINGGAWLSSSSQVWYKNYVAYAGSQTAYSLPSTIYPSIGIYYSSPSSSITFQWVRLRAYPPNGVMPIESIGPLNGQAN